MASLIRRETDYAIRITAYLAGREKERVKVSDICEKLFLTKPIVIKIIQVLKKKDLIEAKTGKAGGIKLLVDPSTLSVLDVIMALDNQTSINDCNDENDNSCQLRPICRISKYLKDVQSSVLRQLEITKISQLAFRDSDLKKLNSYGQLEA